MISGCAANQNESAQPNSETVYRLPWFDASGEYSLQDVSLPTFLEPDKLRGSAAEIIVNPRVDGGTIVGEEPIGRWVRSGSRMIPADPETLQAATVYAHIEKLAEIDRDAGVAKFLLGRERVGILAMISDGQGAPAILNNAVYDGRLDSLFVVPYSPRVGLHISLNAGIIGHEHFHRVFQAIILNPIREAARNGTIPYGWDDGVACAGARPEVPYDQKLDIGKSLLPTISNQIVSAKIFNQVLVRGVNEGFADFWGWAYSHDENFVGRSLGTSEDAARRLDKRSRMLPQKATLRNQLVTVDAQGLPVVKSEAGRVAAAYRFGTEYARVLRGLVDTMVNGGEVDRETAVLLVRQALATSLTDISLAVLGVWGHDELEPEMMLKPVLLRLLKSTGVGGLKMSSKASAAICGELLRMQASTSFTTGICDAGIAPVQSLEP